MHVVVLRNEHLSAEVLPQMGGALARLDSVLGAASMPVLRPFTQTDSVPPRPNQLACFPLVPWSNRMAGGFTCDGRSYNIAPNREGDQYPIHGEGWQRPWQVEEQSGDRMSMLLDRRDGFPFSYLAKLEYALRGASLEVTLEVTNSGSSALPFGLGLHPFMPRSAGVTLRAPAQEAWLSGADRLPAQAVAVPDTWRFGEPCALPGTLVDNIFTGWDGRADIDWQDRGISLRIEADMAYYILYTPAGGDFFCFEPVDHMINAHNMPGGAVHNGLTMLVPGEKLRREVRFTVNRYGV
jgi:aldose 1-epimerase